MKTTRDNKQTVNYRHILQKINFTRKSLLKEVYKQLSYSLNRNLELDGCPSKENLYGQSPSKHSSWWRRTEDVFSVTFFCLPRRLEDILQDVLQTHLEDSWKRLARCLEDVFKTSLKKKSVTLKTSWKTNVCWAALLMNARYIFSLMWFKNSWNNYCIRN